MKSKLERTWWFIAIINALAAFATNYLLEMAGLQAPFGAARWCVYLLCFIGFNRLFSFTLWLMVLAVSPKTATGQTVN